MKSQNVPRWNNTRIQKNRESKVSSGQIDRLGTSSVKLVYYFVVNNRHLLF
jgi:hypothetical protein